MSRIAAERATNPCLACMLHHAPPACTHDSAAPCSRCGRKVGYRFTADDGSAAGDGNVCASCYWRNAA